MDARATNPYASGSAPPRRWLVVVNGGALFTIVVLLFLAWIQPVSNQNERIDLPPTFRFKVEPAPPKRVEQPPREDRTPPKKPQRVEKPKKTTVTRSTQNRTPRPMAKASSARQTVRGLDTGVSLGASIGGGGGPALVVGDEFGAIADEVQDLVEYKELQDKIRNQRFDREQDESDTRRSMGVAKDAVLLMKPTIPYPAAAKQKGISGTVQFRALIGVDGLIEEYEIIRATPEGWFEEAVDEYVVPRLKFKPAQDADGRPLPAWQVIQYRFELTN